MNKRNETVEKVLAQLPAEVNEQMTKCDLTIFSPEVNDIGLYLNFPPTKNENGTLSGKVIYLSPLLERSNVSTNFIVTVLLHELAHWYLNHKHVFDESQERETWELIKKWGFQKHELENEKCL